VDDPAVAFGDGVALGRGNVFGEESVLLGVAAEQQ